MGYSITIGELEIETHDDDGLDCTGLSFDAVGVSRDEAPAFGEPTDYTNSRWPSYTSWSNCLRDAGIYDLFFDNGHLIGGHPGVRLVTKEFVEEFKKRKQVFEQKYPNVQPTYGENHKGVFGEVDEDNPEENSVYCRVVWLDYWLTWALENCKVPVIANH